MASDGDQQPHGRLYYAARSVSRKRASSPSTFRARSALASRRQRPNAERRRGPVGQRARPAARAVVAGDEARAGRAHASRATVARGVRVTIERDRFGPRARRPRAAMPMSAKSSGSIMTGACGAPVRAQVRGQRAVLAVEAGERAHRLGARPDAVAPDGRDQPDRRPRTRPPTPASRRGTRRARAARAPPPRRAAAAASPAPARSAPAARSSAAAAPAPGTAPAARAPRPRRCARRRGRAPARAPSARRRRARAPAGVIAADERQRPDAELAQRARAAGPKRPATSAAEPGVVGR